MITKHSASEPEQRVAGLTRRDWFRMAAAAVATSHLAASGRFVCGSEDPSLREKAGKNITLGVHTGPYVSLPLAEAAERIGDAGFKCVLTEYTFADVRFDPLKPDWEAASRIVKAFEQRGIRISAVFGYVNVVDPLPERMARNEARMKCLIENWERLGCANISTETGTFNTTSDWAVRRRTLPSKAIRSVGPPWRNWRRWRRRPARSSRSSPIGKT